MRDVSGAEHDKTIQLKRAVASVKQLPVLAESTEGTA